MAVRSPSSKAALEAFRQRSAPEIYVVGVDGSVRLSCGQDAPWSAEYASIVADAIADGVPATGSLRLLGDRILRIFKAVAPQGDGERFCVVVERSRGDLDAAVKRYGFTARERDVVSLMLRGANTSEIARTLGIADTTVADYVKKLAAKTDVHNRAQIIARILGSY